MPKLKKEVEKPKTKKKVSKATKKKSSKVTKKSELPSKDITEVEKSEWIPVRQWAKKRGVGEVSLYNNVVRKLRLGNYQKRNARGHWRVQYPECDALLNELKGIDVDAPEMLSDDLPPPRGNPAAGSGGGSNPNAKNEKDTWAAKNERLKFEKASGLLVEKDFVSKKLFQVARTVRNKILSLPPRVAGELSAMMEAADIEMYLQREIVDLLGDLSLSLEDLQNELD